MIQVKNRDIHILRYFSSFISISDGKVVNVTEPALRFCPLACHLYKSFRKIDCSDRETLKHEIKKVIESKIRDYGFFTAKRKLLSNDAAIPYGASEMLMSALKKRFLDAVVVVCDGAGTVVTDNPELVQGIGARMNSILLTSPIKAIIARLKELGCKVVFENGLIDQARGVQAAIANGHRKIAVTVSGHDSDKLKGIRQLELSTKSRITILVVCTTGITGEKIENIRRYADIVWSCASLEIRQKIGAVSLLQVSKQIPVFVLTQNGINLLSIYADKGNLLSGLNKQKQYLISNEPVGEKIKLGSLNSFLREEELPVLSGKSLATLDS
ncbi:MAG: methanogenesis marker 8 protein [Candidatus Omnitrophota bacterium]|jgi:putative methanogenesis marker protein 8